MFNLGGINGARAVFSTSGFRLVAQFTSSATNSICSDFMVDYLVNSLGFSKDEAIVTSSKALKSVVGDNISLLRALKMSRWTLAPGFAKKLPLNVALLQKYGLSADKIGTLFSKNPHFFVRDPERLQAVFIKIEERFQIRRDSPMFYHAIYAFHVPEETMESKIEIYKSFGWTDSDVLTLARKNPYALVYSESKIRKTLSFYMKQLGYQPAELASCSFMLSLSFEKRVVPRYEVLRVLKEKGLIKASYSLSSCLILTESKFLKRFVLPFKDEVPKLYEEYTKKVRSHLKAVD